MNKHSEGLKQVELTTASLVEDTSQLQADIKELRAFHKFAESKLDDYEGRMRRNNIRILAVLERSEGQATDLFVEDLILNHLQPKGLGKLFVVERAHRVPGGRPKPGDPPRPILARILNFRDRDVILQHARTRPPLAYENANITFFPDFTQAVQRQRRTFLGIKKRH